MNKYQEALDCVFNTIYGHKAFYKELKQFREKHKQYPEDVLQELVDIVPEYRELKEWRTPMRPIKKLDDDFDYEFDDSYTHHYCPICENEVEDTYCPHCGQALDWSEENE